MSELNADALRERLAGEQLVHRLREWADGDTLFGVTFMNPDTGASMGKTFREGDEYGEGAESKAREHYESGIIASGVTVLFRGTVRDPRTEPRDPEDPGEPPLKFATLTDVEILDWKRGGEGNGVDGDE